MDCWQCLAFAWLRRSMGWQMADCRWQIRVRRGGPAYVGLRRGKGSIEAEEEVEVGADGTGGGFDAPGFFEAKQESVADFFFGGVGVGRLVFGDLFVGAEIVVFAQRKGFAIEAG